MTTAIVDFRTKPNGAFNWMKGKTRGYWRVLEVEDPQGCTRVNSKNVVRVLWRSGDGLLGVTERSSYYLGHVKADCERRAAEFNARGASV